MEINLETQDYFNSQNICYYYDHITQTTNQLLDKYDFEFIITNNCSADNSFELLKQISQKDHCFKIFHFSHNYGYQKPIWDGYCQAKGGGATIEFGYDLQDPPELLESVHQKFEAITPN